MTLATATDPDAPIKSATLNSGTLDPSLAIDNVSGLITVGSSIPFPGTYSYSVSTTDSADGTRPLR